jgi:hypothetical protein
MTTYPERAHDRDTGQYQPAGQVTAEVAVVVAVRALELLDALAAVLVAGEAITVQGDSWPVDWDNPAWPLARADAVQAAIRKARDYAAALGGPCAAWSTSPTPGYLTAAARSSGSPAAAWRPGRPAGAQKSPMRPRLIRCHRN